MEEPNNALQNENNENLVPIDHQAAVEEHHSVPVVAADHQAAVEEHHSVPRVAVDHQAPPIEDYVDPSATMGVAISAAFITDDDQKADHSEHESKADKDPNLEAIASHASVEAQLSPDIIGHSEAETLQGAALMSVNVAEVNHDALNTGVKEPIQAYHEVAAEEFHLVTENNPASGAVVNPVDINSCAADQSNMDDKKVDQITDKKHVELDAEKPLPPVQKVIRVEVEQKEEVLPESEPVNLSPVRERHREKFSLLRFFCCGSSNKAATVRNNVDLKPSFRPPGI